MNSPNQRFRLDEGWIVLGSGFAFICIYALTEAILESIHRELVWAANFVLHVVRDLGIAFLVGGVVSLGIERVSRHRFQKEIASEVKSIQTNVINSAYMKDYPESYTSMMKDTLQSEVFCRIGLNVDVDIQLPDEVLAVRSSEDMVIFEQISSGRVRNISSSNQVFRPKIYLGKDWDLRIPELLSWRVGERELSPDEIDISDQSTPDSTFTKWFEFPDGINLRPGEEIYTYTKVRNYKRARDVTCWSGLLASDSLRFTVMHPPTFEVFVQAKMRNRGGAYPLTSDGRRVTVEIFGGTPPHAAVELGWRPKPLP